MRNETVKKLVHLVSAVMFVLSIALTTAWFIPSHVQAAPSAQLGVPPYYIAGKVLKNNGDPVVGITVRATGSGWATGWTGVAVTDATGSYKITGITQTIVSNYIVKASCNLSSKIVQAPPSKDKVNFTCN